MVVTTVHTHHLTQVLTRALVAGMEDMAAACMAVTEAWAVCTAAACMVVVWAWATPTAW